MKSFEWVSVATVAEAFAARGPNSEWTQAASRTATPRDDRRSGRAPRDPRSRRCSVSGVVVCRKLRTKQSFGSPPDALGPDWRSGASTTDVFWCLRTMETWGPDDRLAHPHRCCAGRTCFEAPPGGSPDLA
jgi:hypothetical protein